MVESKNKINGAGCTLPAAAPEPPYYAVIFSSQLSKDTQGYAEMAQSMLKLAQQQPGFLGVESAREPGDVGGLGLTVSYWKDEASIHAWKQQLEHQTAQKKGRGKWYRQYTVRIARVERSYSFSNSK